MHPGVQADGCPRRAEYKDCMKRWPAVAARPEGPSDAERLAAAGRGMANKGWISTTRTGKGSAKHSAMNPTATCFIPGAHQPQVLVAF